MKKILKWIGIGFVGFILLGVIAVLSGSGDKKLNVQESLNSGYQAGSNIANGTSQTFTKDNALQKIQQHKITVELQSPTIPIGTTILDAYEIRGKVPAIKNLGWNVEVGHQPESYTVSFKQSIGADANPIVTEARWQVTKDGIQALNGTALTYTPEFGTPTKAVEGSDTDKQVYDTLNALMKKYDDETKAVNNPPTADQLNENENRAVADTARQFGLTEKEVRGIFIRLEASKYSQ